MVGYIDGCQEGHNHFNHFLFVIIYIFNQMDGGLDEFNTIYCFLYRVCRWTDV